VDLKGVPVPRPFRARARLWAGVAAVTAGVGLVGVLPAVRVPWAGRKAVPPPPGLQISTSPSGASVFVGGVEMGKSPLFLTGLAPGAHAIRIVHAGFAPAELTVETAADSPPMPLRFALQPLTATLKVEAEPPAQVELDGRAIGSTPLAGQRVSAGVHRVVARRRGFRTWIRTVYAGPGETVALEARLSPASGPGGAEDQMRLRNWVRRGDLVKLGPGVEPPRKLAGEPAAVPEAARRLRLKGTVAVELTVTETGDVVDPRVVQSAGEVLDEALLAAVKDWRYEPAEANGVKVRVRIEVRQTFS
jgi:TonB family protein